MARAALWLAALAAAACGEHGENATERRRLLSNHFDAKNDKKKILSTLLRLHRARVTPVDYRWHNNRTVHCRDESEIAAAAVRDGVDPSIVSRCYPVDVCDRYFTSIVEGGTTWFFARADTVHDTGTVDGAASFFLSGVGPGRGERPKLLFEASDVAHNTAALQWPGSTSVLLLGGRSARPGLYDGTHGGVFAYALDSLRPNPRIRPLFGAAPVFDGGPGIPGCVDRHASLPGAEAGWCEFDGRLSIAVFKGRLHVFARANLEPLPDATGVRAVQYTSVDAGAFLAASRRADAGAAASLRWRPWRPMVVPGYDRDVGSGPDNRAAIAAAFSRDGDSWTPYVDLVPVDPSGVRQTGHPACGLHHRDGEVFFYVQRDVGGIVANGLRKEVFSGRLTPSSSLIEVGIDAAIFDEITLEALRAPGDAPPGADDRGDRDDDRAPRGQQARRHRGLAGLGRPALRPRAAELRRRRAPGRLRRRGRRGRRGATRGGPWSRGCGPTWPSPRISGTRPRRRRWSPAADCVAGTSFGKPEYVQRARNWWSSMAAAWALVAAKEAADGRYDAVVFSRPDILFGGDMGPHCAYDRSTWYSGGKGSPDHFWILPRDAAADVLGGSLDAFETCAGAGAPCCARTSPLGGNMFSWYVTALWRHKYALSTRLVGNGSVVGSSSTGGTHLGCGAPNCGSMC
ncbi:hypothetical protein JL720_3738 [Aureococcus anophagefferens]|nr:hypothetical protein JL720_3738 [Aureococcus anophagefferens]